MPNCWINNQHIRRIHSTICYSNFFAKSHPRSLISSLSVIHTASAECHTVSVSLLRDALTSSSLVCAKNKSTDKTIYLLDKPALLSCENTPWAVKMRSNSPQFLSRRAAPISHFIVYLGRIWGDEKFHRSRCARALVTERRLYYTARQLLQLSVAFPSWYDFWG